MAIRRTKTKQEKGHTVFIPCAKSSRCPVKALEKWLALSGIERGPVFRPINCHDQITSGRELTPQSVALVLKGVTSHVKSAEAAKSVAGHSLRSGYCTEAASSSWTTIGPSVCRNNQGETIWLRVAGSPLRRSTLRCMHHIPRIGTSN